MTRVRFERGEGRPGTSRVNWLRWLWISLAVHLLILAVLSAYKSQTHPLNEQMLTRIHESERKTRQIQMQRKLEALKQMQQQLAQGTRSSAQEAKTQDDALSTDPKVMLARAKAIVAQIDQQDQQQRAQELARKAKMPAAKALASVKSADAARAAQAPGPASEVDRQLSDLAEHARHTLASQRQRASQAAATGSSGDGNSDAVSSGKPSLGRRAQGSTDRGVDAPGAWNAPVIMDNVFLDQRDYGPMLSPPPVDPAHRVLGTGRTIGAGGTLAHRMFLNRWHIIGPFAGHGAKSQDTVYPPELGVDLDAVYEGKNQIPLQWQFVPDAVYPVVPAQRAENAVFYAYTEVRVDRDMDVWFNVGADDDSKMWINDDLVWASNQGDKPWYHQPFYALHTEIAQYNLVEGRVRVHLHRGVNRVLFKLYNGIDLTFFAVVLTP